MTTSKDKFIQKTGRRKTAVARVRLLSGKGNMVVNDKSLAEFFQEFKEAEKIVQEALLLVGLDKKFDISVKVLGGGKKSQLYAIRLGVARSLIAHDESLRTTLKKNGFLTRDARVKERKKYGLKRARKAPQYRKR